MNKTVVVFESKYGSTRQYAQWIAEELSCDIWERKLVKPADLKPYATIIYGGGLYAGGVAGLDLITQNFDRLRDKNLILFTCGLADPTDPGNIDSIKKSLSRVLTPQMRDKIKIFHLRGGIDYQKLGPVHGAMMAFLRIMIAKKDEATLRGEDKEMLATYGKVVDFKDKKTALPLIQYVRGL